MRQWLTSGGSRIGVKIFAIALALFFLMAVVSAITTRLAQGVGDLLGVVVEDFVPAQAALGRANVRSLEQALQIRRMLIEKLEHPDDQGVADRYAASLQAMNEDVSNYIAAARAELKELQERKSALSNNEDLVRLDTRLEALQAEILEYDQAKTRLLDTVRTDDLLELQRQIATLDEKRDDLDPRLDRVRQEMLHLIGVATERIHATQFNAIVASWVVTGLAGLLGLIVAGFVTMGLVKPVRRLLDGTTAVRGGALDTVVPVTTHDEIGGLTLAFNDMVVELRSKARIRETFGKYIDPRIVQGLLDSPTFTGGEGERRTMTILFCDMAGYSTIAETLTAKAMVAVMNRYLTRMSAPVRAHDGVIDKYVGDAVVAFWGPPFNDAHAQAALACFAALDAVAALPALQAEIVDLVAMKRNAPRIDVRIGIATGEVIVGDIGSDVTRSFTVMGDTVNIASRIEGVSKLYGTRILVTGETAWMAADAVELREIDRVLVVGRSEVVELFEVMARKGQADAATGELCERYAAGLAAYRRRDWAAARTAFAAGLVAVPGDGPSRALVARIDHFEVEPPPPDWDAVWPMHAK